MVQCKETITLCDFKQNKIGLQSYPVNTNLTLKKKIIFKLLCVTTSINDT